MARLTRRGVWACAIAGLLVVGLAPRVGAGAGVGTRLGQGETADARIAEARALFEALDYERALVALDRAMALLESRRTDPAARDLLRTVLELRARTHVGLGALDRAREDFTTLVTLSPDYRLSDSVSPRVVALFTQVRAQLIGQLALTLDPPDAQVLLDGRPIDIVADPVEVLSGEHTVAVTRGGFKPASVNVSVEAGRTTEWRITLERASATLSLQTIPSDVEVRINGTVHGSTTEAPLETGGSPPDPTRARASAPLVVTDLAPGAYTIELRKPCHQTMAQRVTIEDLRDYRVDPFTLAPAVGTIQVGTSRAAQILLDGQAVGDAPRALERVCEGVHVVEARTRQGRDIRRVEVRAGERATLSLAPRPVIALLTTGGVVDPAIAQALARAVPARDGSRASGSSASAGSDSGASSGARAGAEAGAGAGAAAAAGAGSRAGAGGDKDSGADGRAGLTASQASAGAGADLREHVERALAPVRSVLVYAPPAADVRRAEEQERAAAGWLAFDRARRPLTTSARQLSAEARRDLSARLAKALDVQAVAALVARGGADTIWLAVLAAGASEPDVIEVSIDRPDAAVRAVDAATIGTSLLRRSLGLTFVDVLNRPGPMVLDVTGRAPASASTSTPASSAAAAGAGAPAAAGAAGAGAAGAGAAARAGARAGAGGAGATGAGAARDVSAAGATGAAATAAAVGSAIAPGDTLTHVNGNPVPTEQDLRRLLEGLGPTERVTLRLISRAGETRETTMPILREPRLVTFSADSGLANVTLLDLRTRLPEASGLEAAAISLNIAGALMRVGQWSAALDTLREVRLPSGAGVSHESVQYLTGLCYAALGRTAEARTAWEAASRAPRAVLFEDGPLVRELALRRLAR